MLCDNGMVIMLSQRPGSLRDQGKNSQLKWHTFILLLTSLKIFAYTHTHVHHMYGQRFPQSITRQPVNRATLSLLKIISVKENTTDIVLAVSQAQVV